MKITTPLAAFFFLILMVVSVRGGNTYTGNFIGNGAGLSNVVSAVPGNVITNANGTSTNLKIQATGNNSIAIQAGTGSAEVNLGTAVYPGEISASTNGFQFNGANGQFLNFYNGYQGGINPGTNGMDYLNANGLGFHDNGNGNIYFDANITSAVSTAGSFVGPLNGNAATATTATNLYTYFFTNTFNSSQVAWSNACPFAPSRAEWALLCVANDSASQYIAGDVVDNPNIYNTDLAGNTQYTFWHNSSWVGFSVVEAVTTGNLWQLQKKFGGATAIPSSWQNFELIFRLYH